MSDSAFQMFKLKNAGYCCSQVMIKMALEEEGIVNEDLVRASNGLCMGVGSTQKVCGVLTAGIQIMGLYAGKGNDAEHMKPEYTDMVDEFTQWFESEFESTECSDLIGVRTITDYQTNQDYVLKCGDILLKGYDKLQEILGEYNFEFGHRELK